MRKYLFAMAVFLLAACSQKEETAESVSSVYVTSPEQSGGASDLVFTGVVEEADNISLGFKTPGQIERIFVKEGDRVQSGQLLAELDADDYRLGVEALQIQYDQLSREVERAQRLFEKQSMSANDFDKASAGLRQLAVQLQVNKNKLAYTKLYAPVSGVIEAVNFSPSEMVDAGTAVFSMLRTGAMEVVCDIPARAYLNRDRFSTFACRSAHDGGASLPLRLVSIVPKADGNQLYRMRLVFDGKDAGAITSGMNVEVSVGVAGEEDAVFSVPASAVFMHESEPCVWVLGADSTVSRRPVVLTGELSGANVTVSAGVSPADRIVRAGASMLHQGQKVKVIEAPAKTNVGGLL